MTGVALDLAKARAGRSECIDERLSQIGSLERSSRRLLLAGLVLLLLPSQLEALAQDGAEMVVETPSEGGLVVEEDVEVEGVDGLDDDFFLCRHRGRRLAAFKEELG